MNRITLPFDWIDPPKETVADDGLCIICKGARRLCGKDRCPLMIKFYSQQKTAPLIDFKDLSGEALANAMKEQIRKKDNNLRGNMQSQGTTPRRLTDLIGSLCDLVSGSGDRGTPVVLIQGYFTNFATD